MQISKITVYKKTITIVSFVFLMSSIPFKTLEAEDKRKTAIEMTYTRANTIIKFRPYDYVLPSKKRRVDILLGRKFGNFSAYGYWKLDNRKRSWLGVRLEYNIKIPNSRVNPKLNVRFFQPLNKNSEYHYYFLPTILYSLDKAGGAQAGLMGYGKKVIGKEGVFYMGPTLIVRLSKYFRARVSFGQNLLGPDNLLYMKLYINFGQ